MAVASTKPRDADVYDLLQREKQRKEHGAYSRTARAYGRSHEWVRKVEARHVPAPELAYEPPLDAYPEPVKPATEPLLQELLDAEVATEAATDLQPVMSPSAQLATDELATLQVSSSALTYWHDYITSLQLARHTPYDDGRWVAAAMLGMSLDICAISWKLSAVTGHWWLLAATVLIAVPMARMCIKTIDSAWPLWKGWVLVFALACFVAWMAWVTLRG